MVTYCFRADNFIASTVFSGDWRYWCAKNKIWLFSGSHQTNGSTNTYVTSYKHGLLMALEGLTISIRSGSSLHLAYSMQGDGTSPASFEKTLSTLSNKITRATTKLDSCRQQARRFKALWTLYSSFVYLLYLMIVAFVVGWKNWGATEYTALAGGPLV